MPSAPVFWDGFYTGHTRAEQGPVNRILIAEAEGLTPGTALDLGCAEGADAIWLAEHGWDVLGVDASQIAVERAQAHAARLGLGQRARFAQHDLGTDFPAGSFDLVSAQFLHSPVAVPGEREQILRRATEAVAPGGHLLVVSHWSVPSWHPAMPDPGHPVNLTLQSPEENLAALQLAEEEWEVVRDELDRIELTGPDGQPGVREDHVLLVRRLES
jgi:SAM-dependent methyltransferase